MASAILTSMLLIAQSSTSSASLCAIQSVSSPATIEIQTISTSEHIFVVASDCVANSAAPPLSLSHHLSSFFAPSFVYSFDAWTPIGANSITLRYHENQTTKDTHVAQCTSCYPSPTESDIQMWISWTNRSEIRLGFGSEIGSNIAMTANYAEYYGNLSIEYVSIWKQVGNCSYTFYEECDVAETTETYTTSDTSYMF